MYEKMLSPIELGNVKLKNRVIFSPTTMGLSEKKFIEKMKEISSGGVAMVIIGDVPVKKGLQGHSLYTKAGFEYYQNVTKVIHDNGALACAQLHQSDTTAKAIIKAMFKVVGEKFTMERFQAIMNEDLQPYITNLPLEKVKEITSDFGKVAILAKKAGFDMVQVHGDRMCGSFSSEIFNKRQDEYGGSAENRARFAVESVKAIAEAVPNFPIDYKLAIRQEEPHYGNAGVLESEVATFVQLLEKAGVTSFHVTLANHSALTDTIPPKDHPYFSEEGCFLKFSDEVRKYTKLPLCSVGGFTNAEFIDSQIENGRIQCVAMSRQLIADPNFVNKIQDGKEKEIFHCIRCNKKCLDGLRTHQGVHCINEKTEK